MPVVVDRGYVSLAELKATLSISAGETFVDDDLARAINAASRLVEQFTGQRFHRDTADVTRVMTASSTNRIDFRVPPLASLTTLSSDQDGDGTFERTWSASEFALRPLNAPADGLPYTHLERLTAPVVFPTGVGRFQVVGQFGWPDVPAEVVEATRIQSARLVTRTREAPLGVAGLAFEGGAMRLLAKLDPDVEVLLNPYVLKQLVR
ncbi:MAG: hypothetical protein M3O70_18340 [Actinomycetota bacterium]|nr:hypothetical protein [Actinomycetota bacterium]